MELNMEKVFNRDMKKYLHCVAKVYAVLPVSTVMPIFWREGMREGGKPLQLAFQDLIFMI